MFELKLALETAWNWREKRGIFSETQACRVFHGPGEASGPFSRFAVDRFGEHCWVTRWENERTPAAERALGQIADFLKSKSVVSLVELSRPEKGVPEEPQAIFGKAPEGRFEVREGKARFWIQLLGARHPGLFLDHLPLREWLVRRAKGLRVLNTFSYTGSLSVAAGLGGASHVTTLDLAKPAIAWAEANWSLNGLSSDSARFIAGDVFEWLPRLKREGQRFDCVILDPPSFSHGKKGSFSTAKDLARLHSLAMDVLEERGCLVTSINSAQIPVSKYEAEILSAARERKFSFQVLSEISLPETFPTRLGAPASDRYLKGWILRRV